MRKRFAIILTLILTAGAVLSGCASSKADGPIDKVLIGYFPNIDHAAGMIAKEKGFYEDALGEDITVEYHTFADGASFMDALKTGELDAGLVGPGPAMNNYTNGVDVRVVAAGSTGGTVIVAREGSGIDSVEDISGKTFCSPRVGCTHDVQFETYMKNIGITSERIGGTMKHQTGNPATYINLFKSGAIDVATAPEPWGSYLIQNANAKVIVSADEISFGRTLPASVYATSADMIENHHDIVQKLVDAHIKATNWINENPEEAQQIIVDSIKEITGQELSIDVIKGAWENMTFTYDIDSQVLQDFADSSYDLQFLKKKPDLSGLIDKQFIEQ